MLTLLIASMAFAGVYTIGTGTTTQAYVPTYGYYEYSWSKTLYTAAELSAAEVPAGQIDAISFDVSNSPSNFTQDPIVVYMRHTTATSLDTTYPDNTQFQEVFNDTFTWNGSGWHTFFFTNSFIWDGVSNIEFLFENLSGTYVYSGYPYFYSHTVTPAPPSGYMTVYRYKDYSLPSETEGYGGETNNRPDIRIYTPMVGPPGCATMVSPANNATMVSTNAALIWEPTYGADGYKVYFGTNNNPTSYTIVNNGTTHNPSMVAGETYYWQVVPYNGDGDATGCPVWSFQTVPVGTVVIGGGDSNLNLPIHPYWGYSYSQSIYRKEDINQANKRIEKISYYWNGANVGSNSNEWVVYMGHTNKNVFESDADWIPFNQLFKVYDGTLNIPATAGWIEITLNPPFTYNNTQNLVIAVDENKPNDNGSSPYFFSTDTNGENRSILAYSDSSNPDPENPPIGSFNYKYLKAGFPNIKMQFGDLPANPIFSITPLLDNDEWDFGMVPVGESVEKEFTVSNTGGGTLTVTTISQTGTNPPFSIETTPDLSWSLTSSGQPGTFKVKFTPQNAGGPFSTVVTITYDTGAKSTHTISFTGSAYEPATLPLTEGWEDGQGDWIFVNGTQTNAWHIGIAAPYQGDYSAYISNDAGVSNAYNTSSTSVSHIYRDIYFPDDGVEFPLNFMWRCDGEGTLPYIYDYLRVHLVETSVTPVAGTLLTTGELGTFNKQANWAAANITLPAEHANTVKRLVFTWRNDASGGVQPPISLDNISLTAIMADDPPNPAIVVSPTDGAINVDMTPTLSWTSGGGNVERYYLSYGKVGAATPILTNHNNGTSTTYPITTALDYEAQYWWQVVPWNEGGGYAQNPDTWYFTVKRNPIVDLPFTFDFTGETGVMALDWERSHTNWSLEASNNAGGTAPELRFNWGSSATDVFRAITPPLIGDNEDGYRVKFKHNVSHYSTSYPYSVMVEVSTDKVNWTPLWSLTPTATVAAVEVELENYLTDYVGEDPFYLAWTFDGNTFGINNWYVDDISIKKIMTGPPAAPILISPDDRATDMDKDGFDLTWEPDLDNGGKPDYYTVFLSLDEDDIFGQHYIEVFDGATSCNPITDWVDDEIVFDYDEVWYWTVVAFAYGNPDVESDPAEIRSFTIESDPTIKIFPWSDDFESYEDFTLDLKPWSQYDGDGQSTYSIEYYDFPNEFYVGSYIAFNPSATTPALSSAWDAYSGDKYAAAFAATGGIANDDWLITPPIKSPGPLKFGFWARSITDAYGMERFNVLISTVDKDPDSFIKLNEEEYIEAPAAWTKYEYFVNVPANQIFFLAIQCVSDDAFAFMVDDAELVIPENIDLAITAFYGDNVGYVNNSAQYEVKVKNVGLTDVASYYVYLKDSANGNTLATEQITELLEPGDAVEVDISWMPSQQGEFSVYAEVSATGDTGIANNVSNALPITVFSENMKVLYVGDPNTNNISLYVPFNFYYEDSVVETIYLASELQTTSGTIEALIYTNYFEVPYADDFQIWMQNTSQKDLADGWLPWSGYTLVYDGIVGGPAGENLIQIPITPFEYTGGNLGIRISREYNDDWEYGEYWLITTDDNYPGRTLYTQSVYEVNHEAPPAGTLLDLIPNIMFMIDTDDIVATLEAPFVEINLDESYIELEWQEQPYAYLFNIYTSEDPYTFEGTPEYIVYGGEGVSFMPTEDKKFFKVTADTYRDIIRSTMIRPDKNSLKKNYTSIDPPSQRPLKFKRESK